MLFFYIMDEYNINNIEKINAINFININNNDKLSSHTQEPLYNNIQYLKSFNRINNYPTFVNILSWILFSLFVNIILLFILSEFSSIELSSLFNTFNESLCKNNLFFSIL